MKTYLIYSKKHSRGEAIWWRPNRAGYTDDLKRAGEYTKEEANDITAISRGGAIAIRKEDAEKLYSKSVIDLGWGSNRTDFASITGKDP